MADSCQYQSEELLHALQTRVALGVEGHLVLDQGRRESGNRGQNGSWQVFHHPSLVPDRGTRNRLSLRNGRSQCFEVGVAHSPTENFSHPANSLPLQRQHQNQLGSLPREGGSRVVESVGRVGVEGCSGEGTCVCMIDGGQTGNQHIERVGSVLSGSETTAVFGQSPDSQEQVPGVG